MSTSTGQVQGQARKEAQQVSDRIRSANSKQDQPQPDKSIDTRQVRDEGRSAVRAGVREAHGQEWAQLLRSYVGDCKQRLGA